LHPIQCSWIAGKACSYRNGRTSESQAKPAPTQRHSTIVKRIVKRTAPRQAAGNWSQREIKAMLYLILSLLIFSGIAGLLALIIEVAGSFLADYGEVHILINQEKDIDVKGGSPLLST